MKKAITYILFFSITLVSLFSLLGYLGTNNWFFDLFSHFKVQYLGVLLIGMIALLGFKKLRVLLFIPFLLLNIYELSPVYFNEAPTEITTPTSKIICINLLSSNRDFKAVQEFITTTSADIVVLQEFTTLWQEKMESSLSNYTHRLLIPRQDNFGIAIYSKVTFSNLEEIYLGGLRIPSIIGNFELNGKTLKLLTTHTLPPIGTVAFNKRNTHLKDIGHLALDSNHEFIVIGDLNISSFSNHFKKLIEDSNLKDSRRQFGVLPSWPTWLPVAYTTLDHCLVSDGILVKVRETGDFLGSDHLPIFVEIGMK